MIGVYNKSVILTYIGAAFSVIGIGIAVYGSIPFAMICLIMAGICDLFDGVIARKCTRTEKEKAFGIQIDSLTDVISFIAFPCVIGLYWMQQAGIIMYPVLVFYTLCGIIRLAWFNIQADSDTPNRYYDGLPVTYAALILPVCYLSKGWMPKEYFSVMAVVIYIILGLLFIVNIKIKKPRGIWYGIFAMLAVVVTILLWKFV